MSRRMDYVVAFDAPAEKIYQDFTNRDYWDTLMAAYRWLTIGSELTTFATGEVGTDIVFKHTMPRSDLPPVARAVLPVDVVVTREQFFGPYDPQTNSAEGTFRATVPAAPGHFGGRYFLTETATGSQLRLASVCKVNIPLVGGTLEKLILSNITQLFDTEGAFMADWVTKHH